MRGRGSCGQQFGSLVPFIINLTGSVSCQKKKQRVLTPYQSVTNSKFGGENNHFWRFNTDLTMENSRWCPTAAPFRGASVHACAPPSLSAPSIPDPQPTNLPEVYLPLELLQIPVTPDNQGCWHRHTVPFAFAMPVPVSPVLTGKPAKRMQVRSLLGGSPWSTYIKILANLVRTMHSSSGTWLLVGSHVMSSFSSLVA